MNNKKSISVKQIENGKLQVDGFIFNELSIEQLEYVAELAGINVEDI